jgi:protein-S-isoprenylcysteine O-methyltransferase Ste14
MPFTATFLYGALFVVAIPVGLLYWASVLSPRIALPPVHAPLAGALLAVAGAALTLSGIVPIIALGRGVPMNAFPPPHLVRTGVFAWIRNPIYLGFGISVAGVAVATGSAGGLWVVAPVVALAMAAVVFGYERHDLRRRFGPDALVPPKLSLPRGDGEAPSAAQRTAVFAWVLIPWLVAYYAVQAMGRPVDAFGTALALERGWPVIQWTELLYASTYVVVPLTPLVIQTRGGLRRFALSSAIGAVVVGLCWLVVPVVATNRPFVPENVLGHLLAFEQGGSRGVAAFPAFHVTWALIAADAWTGNAGTSGRKGWAVAGWSWAILATVSTLTTGMHTLVEVAAGVVVFLLVRRPERSWAIVRGATEWIANSWHEWRVGPVRIINHGAYAAAAAGVGLLVAGSAMRGAHLVAVVWVGVCIVAGAGLWAQWLEGSSRLLRPFGWYGGIIGAVVGVLTAGLTGVPVLPLIASYVTAAPWIQILGRLRCLVNGCCHGGPAPEHVGIRYHHARSRVSQLVGLAGVPIHPTPLYSIAGNLVIGVLLIRARTLAVSDALVLGLYLIASGTARFVEESYRAEPQTPVIARLRAYQWLAIGSVAAGAFCTLIPATARAGGFAPPSPVLVMAALAMAAVTGFSMGVDFPRSNRRFARLAPSDESDFPGGFTSR